MSSSKNPNVGMREIWLTLEWTVYLPAILTFQVYVIIFNVKCQRNERNTDRQLFAGDNKNAGYFKTQ